MRSLVAPALALLVGCSSSGAPDDGAARAGASSLAGGSSRAGAASGGTGGGGAAAGNAGGRGGMLGAAGTAASGGTSGAGAETGSAGATGTAGLGGTVSAGGASAGVGGLGAGGASSGATSGGRSGAGAAGMAAAAGSAGDDRCDVAVYDASKPPTVLSLTGNLGAHDPALIEADGTYYLYATGLGAKTSTNLTTWAGAPAVFASTPAWVDDQVPGATNLWAPDIAFFGGQYHLYYAASTFGSNKSCIGHATRDALGTGSFTDHGSVLCSNASGSSDNFNAIDPNVALDRDGTPWMTFGSFWSGIKLVKLKTDGTRDGTEVTSLADRPKDRGALEGPFIVRRCGYYYLFVSWGACCDTPWDYNIRVGRSTDLGGPYTDKDGVAMVQGGGTLLVEGNSTWTAPGHNAVIFTATGAYNVYHALNANHASATLRVAEIAWDADGWPISAGP